MQEGFTKPIFIKKFFKSQILDIFVNMFIMLLFFDLKNNYPMKFNWIVKTYANLLYPPFKLYAPGKD